MASVGELPVGDGSVLLLEVTGEGPGGVARVGRGGAVVSEVADTLQQAMERVRPALNVVLENTRGLVSPPDTVTVQFGISVSAEAGVVVARGTAGANFSVSVQWNNPSGSSPSSDSSASSHSSNPSSPSLPRPATTPQP